MLLCLTLPVQAEQIDGQVVYHNDFNGPVGSRFPEWKSGPIKYTGTVTNEMGFLDPVPVATVECPNKSQRFLGEFGGPAIGQPGDRDWNRRRVFHPVYLTLDKLPQHRQLVIEFDLYVLRSWDGNSPAYGPDRFLLQIDAGRKLIDTTFSNNPKVEQDRSDQSFPAIDGTLAHNPPWTGAIGKAALGYNKFFAESVYHFSVPATHDAPAVSIMFASELFEGKGTGDESWGLDNVTVCALNTPVR